MLLALSLRDAYKNYTDAVGVGVCPCRSVPAWGCVRVAACPRGGVSVSQRVRVGVLTNRRSYLILYTDLPAPPGLATHWRDGFDYCTGFD